MIHYEKTKNGVGIFGLSKWEKQAETAIKEAQDIINDVSSRRVGLDTSRKSIIDSLEVNISFLEGKLGLLPTRWKKEEKVREATRELQKDIAFAREWISSVGERPPAPRDPEPFDLARILQKVAPYLLVGVGIYAAMPLLFKGRSR